MTDKPEIVDLKAEEDNNIRVSVPLHMLQGNMDTLTKLHEQGEFLPVEGISLKMHERGVVLMLTGTPEQKEIWREKGVRTKSIFE
jgi:hypothetical protein